MAKFPFFKQLDMMDCGPTCLQMIAKHYGRFVTLDLLRTKASITRNGVSMLGISDAAESIGFHTIGIKLPLNKMKEDAPLPFIAHWYQRHFVVVYKFSRDKVYVADPSVGLITYSEDEFKQGWYSSIDEGVQQGIALLLEPTPEFYDFEAEYFKPKQKLFKPLDYIKNYRKLVFQLLLGLCIGSMIQLALPFLTQSVVDVGISTRDINFVYVILIGQLVLLSSRITVDFIRRWILLYLSTRINISLISSFLAKLFKLPLAFFEGKQIGDILRRVDDHSRIERFFSSSSLNILFSCFNLIVFSIVLCFYSLTIFITFISFSALYIGYVLLFMKKRGELDYKRFQETANNQSNLIQTIYGMSEIKMNNSETHKRWEWERIQAKLFRVSMAGLRLQQWQDAGSFFINEGKNILITVLAAVSVINGEMTLGMMLAVQYIIGQLNAPVSEFIIFIREWQDAKISLARIQEVHIQENEENNIDPLNDVSKLSKDFVIDNLTYQYEGIHSAKTLNNVSLIIPEGKVTAIVGASGSGKTTLMKLLLKFYQPVLGTIRLGGEDFNNFKHSDWRNICGVVMQDGYIFSDTIARNIALNNPDAIDRNKLLRAVTIANCKEFIESLSLKYNTKIGMNGIGLSQGQKQRLLIARAVYKDPQVLFFDEATSSLDANNEKIIMENLNSFFVDKTVIIIAHRLSTVRKADQLVVLDQGKVVEVGTHTDLTFKKGKYFELVKNQLELGT